MKKYSLILFLLVSIGIATNAQDLFKPTIFGDSLYNLFKGMDAFEVLDQTELSKVDVRSCYFHNDLKPYLLVWLNKDAYLEYDNREYIKRTFDDEYSSHKVKSWLISHNKKDMIDTVINCQSLFELYLDSCINATKLSLTDQFYVDGGRLPSKILDFHSRLKLPEAYKIINNYWKEDGGTLDSRYFDCMLQMHDPEAIDLYNKFASKAILDENLEALDDIKMKSKSVYLYGSYAMDLKLMLLSVKKRIRHSFSDFPEGAIDSPYNIDCLNPLDDRYFQFSSNKTVKKILDGLYKPMDKIYKLSYLELEEYSEDIITNIKEFKGALGQYKLELESNELYWKKNMPYYR